MAVPPDVVWPNAAPGLHYSQPHAPSYQNNVQRQWNGQPYQNGAAYQPPAAPYVNNPSYQSSPSHQSAVPYQNGVNQVADYSRREQVQSDVVNGPSVYQQPAPSYHQSDVSFRNGVNDVSDRMAGMSVKQSFSQYSGRLPVNLMAEKNIRNKSVATGSEDDESACCDKDVMRSTLGKVPETSGLLQKSRLPFGILMHPFKEDEDIPIIQDRTIVRCRSCRTYINPFVRLMDQRRWQCNLCNRMNDLPDDFLIDPYTKRFMDYPPRQPEIMYGSVEFVAPVEYMVRPPQPAAYLFVFDCSVHAYQLSYIPTLAKAISDHLDMIPGDSRTLIGFIAFDSKVHFFDFGDKQTTHLVMPDIQGKC